MSRCGRQALPVQLTPASWQLQPETQGEKVIKCVPRPPMFPHNELLPDDYEIWLLNAGFWAEVLGPTGRAWQVYRALTPLPAGWWMDKSPGTVRSPATKSYHPNNARRIHLTVQVELKMADLGGTSGERGGATWRYRLVGHRARVRRLENRPQPVETRSAPHYLAITGGEVKKTHPIIYQVLISFTCYVNGWLVCSNSK